MPSDQLRQTTQKLRNRIQEAADVKTRLQLILKACELEADAAAQNNKNPLARLDLIQRAIRQSTILIQQAEKGLARR